MLGRITSMSSQGRLASGAGEDYGIRAVADDRPVPEDLREQYLKYKVNIRVLGVLRMVGRQTASSPRPTAACLTSAARSLSLPTM